MDTTPDEAWDQSWGYADPAQAAAAGRDLVSMYLSHDPSKNVTPAKVKAYHAHGIGVLLNWEAQAGAPLQGAGQGANDGADAAAQIDALIKGVGYTPRSKLAAVFSCDTDTTPAQYPQIDAYFKAAKAAIAGRYLTGVYGEADLVDHLAKAGITDMEWQTYAWSQGRVSSYADFYQYLNGQTLGGASVDFDRVLHPESVGAWWPPGHPLDNEGDDDMTPAEFRAEMKYALAYLTTGGNSVYGGATGLPAAGGVKLASYADITKAVAAAIPTSGGQVDPAALAKAIADDLGPELAKSLGEALVKGATP